MLKSSRFSFVLVFSERQTASLMTDTYSIFVLKKKSFLPYTLLNKVHKLLCAEYQVPVDSLLEIQIFLYMCKEPKKEIVLVDCLLQPQIPMYMLEINISL